MNGATDDDQDEDEAVDTHSIEHPVQRSIRTRNPSIWYGLPYIHVSASGIQEPRGYSEAVPEPEKEMRLAAIVLEVKTLEAMVTWTTVDEPKSRKLFLDDVFLLWREMR